jgi:ankyrin repeat protein
MPALPSWLVVMLPLALLLAVVYLAWRFVRRGMGAVHRAASRGDVAGLKRLLLTSPQAAAAKDLMGLRPLEYAAYWGQIEAAEILLEHGAEVNGGPGWTPLHYAAAQDRPEMVALLLARGADVNATSQGDDSTPLHTAAVKNRPEVAKILIEHGAAIDAKTKSSWTACHFAASDGNVEIMRALLDGGADVYAVNAGNQTPLEVAMANGHPDIIALVQQLRGE